MAGLVDVTIEPPISFIMRQSGAFRRKLADLIPLWRRFDPVLSQIEAEQFASDGHGAWPPLAASTLRQKARHGFPSSPLIRTGRLIGSFHTMSMSAQSFAWGTDVEYAHWHDDGGYVPGRPPQRKLIDIDTTARRRLEQETIGYLNDAAAETWGRA
jgi:phage gpG-like protein